MRSGEKTFAGVVFGLIWVFIVVYGGYNIGGSIMRHEWPKPSVIIGTVIIVLGVALVVSWTAWHRNAQENKKPVVPTKRPLAKNESPRVTFYRGKNSVYVRGPSKTAS